MRSIGIALLMLTISGCAAVSKFKVDSDGQYRFKHEPIVVWAPKECLLDIAVRDTDRSVDFTTAAKYMVNDRAHDFKFVFRDGKPREVGGLIENPNSKMGRPFPWDCYNKFVASVKELR